MNRLELYQLDKALPRDEPVIAHPLVLYPEDEALSGKERVFFNLYLVTALVVFIAMMLLGLTMRLTQAQWADVSPVMFYRFLTMHGSTMISTISMVTLAVMWYFLRKYVHLHLWAFVTNYVLYLAGIACIAIAVFGGGFAGMWTFLYPLPVHSMHVWSINAAALFFVGYLLVGAGLVLFYLDASAAIMRRYGNLGRAMGLQWLIRGKVDPDHPTTIIVSTVVIIANSIGLLAGTVVLVMSLINAYFPADTFNPLVMKELTYWFGHMVANATIFMGGIAVYELLPRYTHRRHPMSRIFIWAYLITCVSVIVVFPHHLLMDFAQPRWLAIIGQIFSWGEGFPVFLVTAWFVLSNIYRSGMRWTMPASLIVLALFGWAAGIVPAILDGTIIVNKVMHNTQWVDGHFHFYLILGVLPMVLATMYHVIRRRAHANGDLIADRFSLPVYLVGGLIFVLAFLDAGRASVPRRYAAHIAQWLPYDKAGSIGAILIVLGMLYFAVRIIVGLLKGSGDVRPAYARS